MMTSKIVLISCIFFLVICAVPFTALGHDLYTDYSPENVFSEFLGDFYNRLVEQGYLEDNPLHDTREVWKRDFSSFVEAIHRFEAVKGGFVTKEWLYREQENPVIYYGGDDQNDLYARFFNPFQLMSIGKRVNPSTNNCSPVPVDAESENLAQTIGLNVQCMYAQYLRTYYQNLEEPRPIFSYDFIENESGVTDFLNAYLQGLIHQGLVLSYSIDVGKESVVIDSFAGANGLKHVEMVLPITSVNLLSPQEEAVETERVLTEKALDSFVYFNQQWKAFPLIVERELLEEAINRVIALNDGPIPDVQARKDSFLSYFGFLADLQESEAHNRLRQFGCGRPTGDPYGASVVTPANNCAALISGFDRGGLVTRKFPNGEIGNGLQNLGSRLSGYGYLLTNLSQGTGTFNISNIASALRNSQTILINAHGQRESTFDLICLDAITYGKKECCEEVKRMATLLGAPNAASMNCSLKPPPMTDPDGLVHAMDSGSNDGCALQQGSHRCWLRMSADALYPLISPVASVFTAQCYGGANCGVINVGNHVKDYMSGSIVEVNFAHPLQHDFRLVGDDLLGKSKAKITCLNEAPENPTSPFCVQPPKDMIFGNDLHTVQSSQGQRGTGNLSETQKDCIPAHNPGTGAEEYCAAIVSGDSDVSVEFAPTVSSVRYDPIQSPILSMTFSSQVQNDMGTIVIDDSNCHPQISTGVNRDDWSIGDSGASVNLSSWPIMTAQDWGHDPAELHERYGVDQSGWRWFLKVRLEGVKAPNGVALDGNGSAGNKKIWPVPGTTDVAPWSNLSGVAANGDPFEVDVPCAPPIQCCYPHLDVNGQGCVVQNGCICGGAPSIQTSPGDLFHPRPGCYTLNPLYDPENGCTGNAYYPGRPTLDASCCDDNICDAVKETTRRCPIQFPCDEPPPPAINQSYQFRSWPMDLNGDEQCATVQGHCGGCASR